MYEISKIAFLILAFCKKWLNIESQGSLKHSKIFRKQHLNCTDKIVN